MFFKKAICVALTFFSISTLPSAMRRDVSSSSIGGDFALVNAVGTDVTITDEARATSCLVVTEGAPTTPKARSATPNSLPDNSRVTPTQGILATPALPPLAHATSLAAIAPASPTSTIASAAVSQPSPQATSSTSSESSAPEKISCEQTAPTENFLTQTTKMSNSFSSSQPSPQALRPQQIPVEALAPLTPNALIKTVVATATLAHEIVHAATDSSVPHTIQTIPTPLKAKPASTNALTEPQRKAVKNALQSTTFPALRTHPVTTSSRRLSDGSLEVTKQKPHSSGDLAITIAPASPNRSQGQESENSTSCCSFMFCGKKITIPSFSCFR